MKLNQKALRLALNEYYGCKTGIPKYEHDAFVNALKVYITNSEEADDKDIIHEQAGLGI